MKACISATVLVMLFFAAVAATADASGTWTGSLATGGGSYDMVYTFKQEGTKLTGTLQTTQGDVVEIQNGKVEGDKVSFVFEVQYNGGMRFTNEGTIKGDEIALKTTHEGGGEYSGTTTLKRQGR